MTIEFNCHVCGKLLRTANEKAGRTAKCPGCGASITVPEPDAVDETVTAEQDAAADDYEDEKEDYEQDEHDVENDEVDEDSDEVAAATPRDLSGTQTCPMCGEQISRSASRCQYCGESLRTRRQKRGRRSSDTSLATISLVSGIAGLLFTFCCGCVSLPASVTAIVVGFVAFSRINAGQANGKGLAIAGIACGAAGLLLFVALFFLRLAIQMGNFDQLNL